MNATIALLTMFAFGFSGSLHCALMCGPLAAPHCLKKVGDQGGGKALRYHLARLGAYSSLGLGAGVLGTLTFRQALDVPARILGLAFALVTLLYSAFELRAALAAEATDSGHSEAQGKGAALNQPPSHSAWGFQRSMARLARHSPFSSEVTAGLLTALLPCGFLYAAVAQAATLAHPAFAALGMFVFGLGTVPALWGGSRLIVWLQRVLPMSPRKAMALFLVLSACVLVFRSMIHANVHQH